MIGCLLAASQLISNDASILNTRNSHVASRITASRRSVHFARIVSARQAKCLQFLSGLNDEKSVPSHDMRDLLRLFVSYGTLMRGRPFNGLCFLVKLQQHAHQSWSLHRADHP